MQKNDLNCWKIGFQKKLTTHLPLVIALFFSTAQQSMILWKQLKRIVKFKYAKISIYLWFPRECLCAKKRNHKKYLQISSLRSVVFNLCLFRQNWIVSEISESDIGAKNYKAVFWVLNFLARKMLMKSTPCLVTSKFSHLWFRLGPCVTNFFSLSPYWNN